MNTDVGRKLPAPLGFRDLLRFSDLLKILLPILKRTFRKILNIGPELIPIFKHILNGLYSEGIIFGGHFVLVYAYQRLQNILSC